MDRATVRIGPAGWSYPDWKGIVYPPGMGRSNHPAAFLAQFFDVIEINSTFYRTPSAAMARKWVRAIADFPRFQFTAKLWQGFTHEDREWPGEASVAEYMEGIAPLIDENRLACILVQFPWRYKRTRRNREHLARIADAFQSVPLCVEFRHSSWNHEATIEALRERSIAFCNIDQPLFDDSLPPTEIVTAPFAYVRLHGRNKGEWFREGANRDSRYNYLYSPEELAPWIGRIESLRVAAGSVYVVTNNHFEGQAIANAFEIDAAITGKMKRPPDTLASRYPRLTEER